MSISPPPSPFLHTGGYVSTIETKGDIDHSHVAAAYNPQDTSGSGNIFLSGSNYLGDFSPISKAFSTREKQ